MIVGLKPTLFRQVVYRAEELGNRTDIEKVCYLAILSLKWSK